MERSHRLLLVAGLLAALLPAAAATIVPQPGAPCEPTLLATQVALFCALDTPTARCCQPVVAAVDLGGGVPCLCRVAAEPQLAMAGLNAIHLLRLYINCGGIRLGRGHLAAACKARPADVVSPPPPSPAPRHKQAPPRDTSLLPVSPSSERPYTLDQHRDQYLFNFTACPTASDLGTIVGIQCGQETPSCCTVLRSAVLSSNPLVCLCALSANKGLSDVGLGIHDIMEMYSACMDIRQGDLHFPVGGCRQVAEGVSFSPQPGSKSLLPPGTSPSATTVPPLPPSTTGPVIVSHVSPVLIATFCFVIATFLLVGAAVAYLYFLIKGNGWIPLRWAAIGDVASEDHGPPPPPPPPAQPRIILLINNVANIPEQNDRAPPREVQMVPRVAPLRRSERLA